MDLSFLPDRMMPMMLYAMPKRPRSRNRYQDREKQVLVDIVKAAEGGKYLELLLVRDMSKNLEKQEVWVKITALFSQVRSGVRGKSESTGKKGERKREC